MLGYDHSYRFNFPPVGQLERQLHHHRIGRDRQLDLSLAIEGNGSFFQY
jgi:hypothetical protein